MKTINCKHCNQPLARYNGVPGDDDQWYHLEKQQKGSKVMSMTLEQLKAAEEEFKAARDK
jgi:hypothetical protein